MFPSLGLIAYGKGKKIDIVDQAFRGVCCIPR